MTSCRLRWLASLAVCAALSLAAVPAETDLDAFMRQVVAKRDDNWKKLQQYVFDEREQFDMRGPTRIPIWGERRDYTWFVRDGFFVRSPVKINGVTIGEADRRSAEALYLKQAQAREKSGQGGHVTIGGDGISMQAGDSADAKDKTDDLAQDIGGVVRQTREPGFISSAYFLRFKFEQGKYALVGRETLDGRDVLRVEYYPTRMFGGTDRRRDPERGGKEPSADEKARDAEFQRLMNKVALVTLWVEPKAHQIVKYTFDNVGFDFLPVQWLVHVSDFKATMTVAQPFPDVWLPTTLEMNLAMIAAFGQMDVKYALEYHDYRRPDVTSKIGIK
jgi:hypothetical protein